MKPQERVAPLSESLAKRPIVRHALREENIPVSILGGLLGYGSESAFSNAFKRVTGQAPKRYRNSVRAASLDRAADPADDRHPLNRCQRCGISRKPRSSW